MISVEDRCSMLRVPTLPVEEVPAGEGDAIDAMVATFKKQISERYQGTMALRDAHPKSHGLVNARFIVDAQCPVELRHGLFATPGRFAAQIRYSNGLPFVRHDL